MGIIEYYGERERERDFQYVFYIYKKRFVQKRESKRERRLIMSGNKPRS